MTIDAFIQDIQKIGCPYKQDAPLGSYSSLQIGGNAKVAAWPTNEEEIIQLITAAKTHQIPYYILGNCSNVLVMDEGFNGLAILFGKSGNNFNKIEAMDELTVRCESGVSLRDLCNYAYDHSLTGVEFGYGIPASIGGAVFMNAGAFDGEIKDIIVECTFINEQQEIVTFSKEELQLSYRHSYFHDHNCCILSAVFQLKPGDKEAIREKMDGFLHRRVTNQPLEYPSAGSTFKRPGGAYAAKLIDDCGLKGYRIGGAMVSMKHTGFVINYDHATSKDVLEIVDHIKKVVKEQTGYQLECEMILLK